MKTEPVGYGYHALKANRYAEEEAVNGTEAKRTEQERRQPPDGISDQQDTVAMMRDALKQDEISWTQGPDSKKNQVKCSGARDNSVQLTRRLVAASGQFEVRNIISEAGNSLIGLRMTAALCSGKEREAARAAVGRLEKLIVRAGRKIRDLDNEDVIRTRKFRAEKQKQQKRVEEIREELRKKQQKRMAREHRYLFDKTKSSYSHPPVTLPAGMDAATEARIIRQAEALAAAEAGAGDGGSGVDAGGTEIMDGNANMESGAGAETASSVDAGVDISV